MAGNLSERVPVTRRNDEFDGLATNLNAMLDRIAELNQRGITFLIIEHNMDLVMNLCRPVVVMAAGKLLMQGEPAEVQRDPRVLDAYLGGQPA